MKKYALYYHVVLGWFVVERDKRQYPSNHNIYTALENTQSIGVRRHIYDSKKYCEFDSITELEENNPELFI